MKLYIDKENILAFMSGKNEDIDLFEGCLSLIKKGLIVYYNFPKSDIQKTPILQAWFGRMKGSGVKFDSYFCPDVTIKPIRPVKSNFYKDYDSDDRSSIYLLNIEENTCLNIRNKHSILIGRPGDEFEIFESLMKITEGRPRLMYKISSWCEYCPKIPLTDAFICDNHYFKDRNVYLSNDNELIKTLASIPKDIFNLVIFTKESEIDRDIDLEEECRKIKDLIVSVSNLSRGKCSVTIITTYSLHSRHIITNYYNISPTTCVHLKNNGLRADANIVIEPHTDPSAFNASKDIINTLQGIADQPIRIFGDKKSNYIKFPNL